MCSFTIRLSEREKLRAIILLYVSNKLIARLFHSPSFVHLCQSLPSNWPGPFPLAGLQAFLPRQPFPSLFAQPVTCEHGPRTQP